MLTQYEAGEIELVSGSTIATGHGTRWINYVGIGDVLHCSGIAVALASVESLYSMTLSMPWPGETLIRSPYVIERTTPEIPPFGTVQSCRAWAKQEIDQSAGQARARYLTVVAGQEATYTAKYLEANTYVAAGYPADLAVYPWIAAESVATGMSPTDTANRIKSTGDLWGIFKGPQIEGVRIAGKDALDGMSDLLSMYAHKQATCTALDAL